MGARFNGFGSSTIVNVTVATSAATVVVSTPPVTFPFDNAQVMIIWYVRLLLGTAITNLVLAVLRGVVASVGNITPGGVGETATAGNTVNRGGCITDIPGAVDKLQYSLQVTQTGATGNGTVAEASILAMCF